MSDAQCKAMADNGGGLFVKTAVTGTKDRETNLVVATVVQPADAETL